MMRCPIKYPRTGDRIKLGEVIVKIHPCSVKGQVFFELRGKPCQIDQLGWIDWCDAMNAEILTEKGRGK